MEPLIPRVKVGDVLRGTRNLRRWLRLSSLIINLQRREEKIKPSSIYTPTKNDSFVVSINAHQRFGVWSLRKNIGIVFTNGSNEKTYSPNQRMNSSLFPYWLIRTQGKYAELDRWPDWAYFMWASLHMGLDEPGPKKQNTQNWPADLPHLDLYFDIGPMMGTLGECENPFIMYKCIGMLNLSRNQVRQMLEYRIPRGLTRVTNKTPQIGRGPHKKDLERMQSRLESLCKNTRVYQKLKSKELDELTKATF